MSIKQLGGKCVECFSADNLEFDHIDPDKKEFDISKLLTSKPSRKGEDELKKCQLLCHTCHHRKTLKENGKKPAVGTHGTLSSCRYCRCSLCRKVKNDYMLKYRRIRRREQGMKEYQKAKGMHGTRSSYRYCKCSLCRAAHAAYMRSYKRKSRERSLMVQAADR